MKFIKTFESYNDNIISQLSSIKGIKQEDIDAAINDKLFFGKDKGLEIARVFHGPVVNKYNTSEDPDWPVWTAIMKDGTKLGYMFEDGYWEKEN